MDIPHEHPTHPNDPNRGLNVKVFLMAVLAAVVVIAIVIAITVRRSTHSVPKPSTGNSTSSLGGGSQMLATKPSPLHQGPVRVGSRAVPLQ